MYSWTNHMFSVTENGWKKPHLKNWKCCGRGNLIIHTLMWRNSLASCQLTAIWEGVLNEWPLGGAIGPEQKALPTEGHAGHLSLQGKPPSQTRGLLVTSICCALSWFLCLLRNSQRFLPAVSRIISYPRRCPHPSPWNLLIHYIIRVRGIKIADEIKVADQLTLRLGDYPELPVWTQ